MSMLDVARYLYYSKSIDLAREEERFFNLSMANSGRLFHCLNAERGYRDWSIPCERGPVPTKRTPSFPKGK